jgi:hypothetical protein
MKKAALVLLVVGGLTLVPASIFAQQVNWDGQYHKGDFSVEIGAGFGSHGSGYGYSVAALPGAEWTVADWKIGEVTPLAMGIAAKGFVEFIPGTGLGLGGGGFAAFHMGFKGLDIPEFFQNMDIYAGIGGGVVFVSGADVPFGLVLPTTYGGFAWFFKENVAAYLEGIYWYGWQADGFGGAVLGIRMKGWPKK